MKLRAIELLQQLVALKRAEINTELLNSLVCKDLLKLVEEHPWNNFISLKIHQIFEDFLESDSSADEKLSLLRDSEVTSKVVSMST